MMQNDTLTMLEPTDPEAHPHYPRRPPHATRVQYTVETELVDVSAEEAEAEDREEPAW